MKGPFKVMQYQHQIFLVLGILFSTIAVQAGSIGHDLTAEVDRNMVEEQVLRKDLEQKLGAQRPTMGKSMKPNFKSTAEAVLGNSGVEIINVRAAQTQTVRGRPRLRSSLKLENKNLNRVANEFQR
jgi:hypothetical protein